MLRVINRHTHVDGSCRLRAIGSGVHHLDGDFFTGQQVADVPHQSLSVYRDNVERYGLTAGARPPSSRRSTGRAGWRSCASIRGNRHDGWSRRAPPSRSRRWARASPGAQQRAKLIGRSSTPPEQHGRARRLPRRSLAPWCRRGRRRDRRWPLAPPAPASSSNFRNQARTLERLRGLTRNPAVSDNQSRLGCGMLVRDDLDDLAIGQRTSQRHDAPIDAGAAAAVPEVGMHVIGEVERRGAGRQVDDLALGRERIDAILEQLGAHLVEEVALTLAVPPLGGRATCAPIRSCGRRTHRARAIPCSASARPVPSSAWSCISRVRICTSTGLAFGTEHRGVDRAVEVVLRRRDVVVELARECR